jgi:hypothetical protein
MNKGVTLLGAISAVVLVVGFLPACRCFAAEEGVALAIVYDTSGSMADKVPDGSGKSASKYVIANKALTAISQRIGDFVRKAPGGTQRNLDAGLYVFDGNKATEAVKFGPFQEDAISRWAKTFSNPSGGTPLGNSIDTAAKALLQSKLPHKHIVVITDGVNTIGPPPEEVIPRLKAAAEKHNTGISFHFVAFDVDAKVFDPVKKLGATVVAAANEAQLKTQLEYIFEHKILLEDEEPKRPEKPNKP